MWASASPASTLTKAGAREKARTVWAEFLNNQAAVEQALNHFQTYSLRSFRRRAAFCPMKGEINALSRLQWPVFLPRTLSSTEMEFREARSLAELLPARYGILEPGPESPIFHLPFTGDDLLVVPALAVNEGRFRLGKGGGYYDRMRAQIQDAVIVAILPDALLELDFPAEAHDLKVHAVITESGVR